MSGDDRQAPGRARQPARRLLHRHAHHRVRVAQAEWLAQIGSGDFTYHAIDQEATDVDVHDDQATLVSRALYTVTLHGSPGRWRLRSTLDWVRVGDQWKAVRGVSTTA